MKTMAKQKIREELINLIEILPDNEIIMAKKFLEFLLMQAKAISNQHEERVKLINELYGICAGLPGGSEEFMKEKHEEIEWEEKRFEERLH